MPHMQCTEGERERRKEGEEEKVRDRCREMGGGEAGERRINTVNVSRLGHCLQKNMM